MEGRGLLVQYSTQYLHRSRGRPGQTRQDPAILLQLQLIVSSQIKWNTEPCRHLCFPGVLCKSTGIGTALCSIPCGLDLYTRHLHSHQRPSRRRGVDASSAASTLASTLRGEPGFATRLMTSTPASPHRCQICRLLPHTSHHAGPPMSSSLWNRCTGVAWLCPSAMPVRPSFKALLPAPFRPCRPLLRRGTVNIL